MSKGNHERIRNASPFYKNQQGKRFGIDGAKRITSQKERNEANKVKILSTS